MILFMQGFPTAYKEARNGKARPGGREGCEKKDHHLPLTGVLAHYVISERLYFSAPRSIACIGWL